MRKMIHPPMCGGFKATEQNVTLSYTIELLTPMIGGGTTSWQQDPAQPIRPSAIKAQLRFWWRTMQGFETKEELLEAESEIFGSTQKASEVNVRVLVDPKSVELRKLGVSETRRPDGKVIKRRDFRGLPKYVLFPFEELDRTKRKEDDFFAVTDAARFQLVVECPDRFRETLENAVKLWILFGGVGSRTRRGAGSLICREANGNEVNNWFSNGADLAAWLKGLVESQPDPPPASSRYARLRKGTLAFRTLPPATQAISAWNSLLGTNSDQGLGYFRQGEERGRRKRSAGSNRPGRSFWPEADSIREITGEHAGRHAPDHPALKWFPRAAFGLPIQFKFSTAGDPGCPNGPRDSSKFNLLPQEGGISFERWPSPCLLKVIALANGSLIAACLFLNSKRPGLCLKGRSVDYSAPPDELPENYKIKDMGPRAPLVANEGPTTALVRQLGLTQKFPL